MINLFGESYSDAPKKRQKKPNPQKRAWENAFQKWCDDNGADGLTYFGACGYGEICDYCKDNDKGRPCVRALNARCRDKGIEIDYSDRNFEMYF